MKVYEMMNKWDGQQLSIEQRAQILSLEKTPDGFNCMGTIIRYGRFICTHATSEERKHLISKIRDVCAWDRPCGTRTLNHTCLLDMLDLEW